MICDIRITKAKDFLPKGAGELLEDPQNKITLFFVKRL